MNEVPKYLTIHWPTTVLIVTRHSLNQIAVPSSGDQSSQSTSDSRFQLLGPAIYMANI